METHEILLLGSNPSRKPLAHRQIVPRLPLPSPRYRKVAATEPTATQQVGNYIVVILDY